LSAGFNESSSFFRIHTVSADLIGCDTDGDSVALPAFPYLDGSVAEDG
jgi:hypothetical protein